MGDTQVQIRTLARKRLAQRLTRRTDPGAKRLSCEDILKIFIFEKARNPIAKLRIDRSIWPTPRQASRSEIPDFPGL
jgi:hypothetical protein